MTKNLIAVTAVLMLLASCGKDNVNNPRGSMAVPEQVTNITVKNVSGASIVYYKTPTDNNLKYVKAVWTTDDNVEYTQTMSRYTDSVYVDGFGDVGTYTVKLYSVSPGGKESKPVTAEISPETPPYKKVLETLEMSETFLGMRVVGANETKASLALRVWKKVWVDGVGETEQWEEVGTVYTSSPLINFVNLSPDEEKPYPAEVEQTFAVEVRDRWGHWSDRREGKISPWFHTKLPLADAPPIQAITLCNLGAGNQNVMQDQTGYQLPSDFWGHNMHNWGSGNTLARLFDGLEDDLGSNGNGEQTYFTKGAAPFPYHVTIDLGKPYSLSQLKLWGRNNNSARLRGAFPLEVELFGAIDANAVDPNDEDSYIVTQSARLVDDINDRTQWESMGAFTLARADGSTTEAANAALTSLSQEDQALFNNGHTMTLTPPSRQVRFVRLQFKSNYAGGPAGSVSVAELQFWGK